MFVVQDIFFPFIVGELVLPVVPNILVLFIKLTVATSDLAVDISELIGSTFVLLVMVFIASGFVVVDVLQLV